MILSGTNQVAQIVLGEGQTTNPCEVTTSWAEMQAPSTFQQGSDLVATNGVTPVTVVPAPSAAGLTRDVREVRLFNADTVTHTVSLQIFDGSATWRVAPAKVSVAANGAFVYTPQSGIVVFDSGSAPIGPAGGDLAGSYPNPTVNTSTATFADLVAHGSNVFTSSNVAVGAGPNFVTVTALDITSIALGIGDWLLFGNAGFGDNTTTYTSLNGWISTTSATFPTRPNAGAFVGITATYAAGSVLVLPVGFTRLSLGAPATVYLSAQATFTGSAAHSFGFLAAVPLTGRT